MNETRSELLVCPETGEPCNFGRYCAIAKRLILEDKQDLEMIAGKVVSKLSPPLNSILYDDYCSERRIEKLWDLAADKLYSNHIHNMATILIEGITRNRINS